MGKMNNIWERKIEGEWNDMKQDCLVDHKHMNKKKKFNIEFKKKLEIHEVDLFNWE